MNRLIALVRREYWENKGAFRTTPLVIGCIYIAFLLMSIFTTAHIDSDLYTFGYRFKPWVGAPIASGDEILTYMGEVIDENGLHEHIRYQHHITTAKWSSEDKMFGLYEQSHKNRTF